MSYVMNNSSKHVKLIISVRTLPLLFKIVLVWAFCYDYRHWDQHVIIINACNINIFAQINCRWYTNVFPSVCSYHITVIQSTPCHPNLTIHLFGTFSNAMSMIWEDIINDTNTSPGHNEISLFLNNVTLHYMYP